MTTDESPPSARPLSVDELASACVQYVHGALRIELDFTPDTLPILDHYLQGLLTDDPKEEITNLVVMSAGAYFGEVVRRTLGHARWHIVPDDPTDWRLELEHVFLFFNPLGMAREAIVQAEQPGWLAHLEVLPRDRPLLDQSLAHMGDVREDDYYRLAIRYEVIEQVMSALEGASIAREAQDELFTPAVYAATARALRGEGTASTEGN